jgi:enoyl-CoA hydratase/carnithine racemase
MGPWRIVMGGGMGVFAAGSYRVVTEKTRLAMPEITIGLYPDVGGSYFLNRMPGHTGLFLALTGASFNAADALYLGLAEGFVEHQYAGEVLNALTETVWSTGVAENQERVFDLMATFVARSKAAMPAGNVEAAASEIAQLCSVDDDLTVINTIIAAQSDNPWIQKAAATLASGSPLSARLIAEQIRRCRGISLKAAFQAEVLLSTAIIRRPEFAEGVRALLIDKDKNPAWQHASPADVPQDLIDQHFTAPWAVNPLGDL